MTPEDRAERLNGLQGKDARYVLLYLMAGDPDLFDRALASLGKHQATMRALEEKFRSRPPGPACAECDAVQPGHQESCSLFTRAAVTL